ncbi:hypothetical protein V6N12_006835 [Hibiscus sabdariffa]|uniref:PPPDE domain-containing protein n=1 Tax=Hibiscus sabdariffa TaxID=183260 RepID=A0ABR2F009_9ROSI
MPSELIITQQAVFRKSVFIGTTCLDPARLREFMERQSASYNGGTYHLIFKNCNHFCEDICYKLTGNQMPKWVNRLARVGSFCNCILPEALKATVVHHDYNFQSDNEKKRLRSAFSCLWSILIPHRETHLLMLMCTLCLIDSGVADVDMQKSGVLVACGKPADCPCTKLAALILYSVLVVLNQLQKVYYYLTFDLGVRTDAADGLFGGFRHCLVSGDDLLC